MWLRKNSTCVSLFFFDFVFGYLLTCFIFYFFFSCSSGFSHLPCISFSTSRCCWWLDGNSYVTPIYNQFNMKFRTRARAPFPSFCLGFSFFFSFLVWKSFWECFSSTRRHATMSSGSVCVCMKRQRCRWLKRKFTMVHKVQCGVRSVGWSRGREASEMAYNAFTTHTQPPTIPIIIVIKPEWKRLRFVRFHFCFVSLLK